MELNYVVFSDLDGTLLDEQSYSHQPAAPALAALSSRKIPLVFCTSKTRTEVEALRRELGNRHPFIVENGGAVLIPMGYFPFPVPTHIQLGVPYRELVAALRAASKASGCPVIGFHDMTVPEVARRCRMSLAAAKLAKSREYDEPFEILTGDRARIGSLWTEIEELGFTRTRGGRFCHVRGKHDKSQAAAVLAELYRRWLPAVVTVALGDGPNDVPLLEAVDVPIWIPSHRQPTPDAGRSWATAPHFGPRGWGEAILALLQQGPAPESGCLREPHRATG